MKSSIALVAEGGGMRGIFTAGVLDVFMERGFDPFDLYLGVSAGACNISSHLAGQHRRNYRVITRLMTSPDFISVRKWMAGGHMMDLDYLWQRMQHEEPLNVPALFRRKRKRFVVVATSAETGTPVYLTPTQSNCLTCLKASSAVPLLYRGFVEVEGIPMVDGGVTDPIPAEEAWRMGARRIVVVRTRPPHFVKKKGIEHRLAAVASRGRKRLAEAIRRQAEAYRRSVSFILSPPHGVEILQIAPSEPLRCGRTTQDPLLLQEDYEHGRRLGEEFVEYWTRNPIGQPLSRNS